MTNRKYFKVLMDVTPEKIAELVNLEIKKGLAWKPIGSIIQVNDMGMRYYQAMTRPYRGRIAKENEE